MVVCARKQTDKPRLTLAEKLEIAADAVVNGVGKRTYAICGVVMAKIGCSRRTAYRLVTRARERLAAKSEKRLHELGSALPALWGDALRAARAEGDHKAVVRLLALAADLTGKLPPEPDRGTPTTFQFVTWDGNGPEPGTGEADTS